MSLLDQMQQDAADRIKIPTDEDLQTVGELAREQVRLESRFNDHVFGQLVAINASVPELEAALAEAKDSLSNIKENKLPNAVEQFGLTQFKLSDGSTVTIKEEVYAGITEDNKPAAFGWLKSTGNEGIIKHNITCPFGKGEDSAAETLIEKLDSLGYTYTNTRSVHPQTLRAFVKKQLEAGTPIPLDLFSIHVKKQSTIKLK